MRKTGIKSVRDLPWGTHFCLFYQTKEDLIEILVPFFKEGLENNEFCMWITSDPLEAKEAKTALKKVVKDLETYLKNGRIEIFDASKWYTKSGKFESDKVLAAWIEKEKQALNRGYDGLRCSGNTSWVEQRDWRNFVDYETKIHNLNGNHRMLAVCPYSLDKCGASEVLDLVGSHQFALIKRENRWELIESAERKKSNELLCEAEQRWRYMVQNTPDIILTVDCDGIILASNRAVLGITTEQVIGKNIFDYIESEYRSKIMKSLEQVFQTRKPDTCTILGAGARGLNTAWYETLVVPIKHNNQVMAVTLKFRDITDRKQAEEAMRQTEEKIKIIIKTINDVIFQFSDSGIITYASPRVKEVYGYKPEELAGKHIKEITPMNEVLKFLEKIKSVLSGKKVKNFKINQIDNKGKIIYAEINMSPVEKAGKIETVLCILKDITGQKKSEERHRIEKTYLDHLLETALEAIVMTDKDGRIIRVNNEFIRLFGYTIDELLGQPIDNLVAPMDHYDEAVLFTNRVANGDRVSFEAIRRRKDGTLVYVSVVVSPIRINGELLAAYGIYRDMNGGHRIEKEEKVAH